MFKQILLFVISLGISQHFNNVPLVAQSFSWDPGAEFAKESKDFEAPYEPTPMAVRSQRMWSARLRCSAYAERVAIAASMASTSSRFRCLPW